MNLVVSDASPIRYLVVIDAIHVLPSLFSKVIIPEHVARIELQRPRTPTKVRNWLSSQPDWVEIRRPVRPETLNLHTGEEHAIALAVELKVPILLDEKEARGVARRKGLLVVGTIGLLEQAASKGLINLSEALQAVTGRIKRDHPGSKMVPFGDSKSPTWGFSLVFRHHCS